MLQTCNQSRLAANLARHSAPGRYFRADAGWWEKNERSPLLRDRRPKVRRSREGEEPGPGPDQSPGVGRVGFEQQDGRGGPRRRMHGSVVGHSTLSGGTIGGPELGPRKVRATRV
jgi:hypothetical protein